MLCCCNYDQRKTDVDYLGQYFFAENPGFRMKGCPWTCGCILFPFKCRADFIVVSPLVFHIHGNEMMAGLGQYIGIHSFTAEEDKDLWAEKQDTDLNQVV